MSSPETRPRRLVAALLLAGLASASLTACTTSGIRPLYGGAAGGETVAALRSVDVVAPGRIGQQIRNDLVFGFSGGAGEPERPRWRVEITTTMIDTAVGIDRYSNLATAHIGQVSATWIMTEIATGRTIATGTSFANATYDYSQQRFADLRARRDAENRAAGQIALDIRNKIAVRFAEHPEP
jgi:LPS-assembly lipoprotein